MLNAVGRVRGPVPLWVSFLSIFCLGSLCTAAWSQEIINATADAYTKEVDPNLNFGDRDDFRAQNWANIRGFVKFNTSSFSGTSASSAYLELYVAEADASTTIDIHKVLADWDEYTLTSNNQPAYNPQEGASFTVSSADVGTTLSVDITGLFNQLLSDPTNDFGLVLRTSYLKLVMDARETGNGLRIVATPAGGGSNQAPTVNAGADRTVTVGVPEPLAASVSDDGLPNPPAATTIGWSKLSGPGSVNFDDASDPTTDVSISTPGTYVLRLSADDNEYETTDDVEVTVIDPPHEITLTTTGDTTTKQGEPDRNFGEDAKIRIQQWSQLTGWYAFDFASLPPGFQASDAQLKFRIQAVGMAGSITVHKALGSWSESTLTHNNKPALGPVAATFNIAASDLDTIMQVDITALFNELASDPLSAYGIVLKTTDANFWTDSRESGTATWIIATPQQVNLAPEANAGADTSLTLPANANLSGSVSDDGLPNPPGTTSVAWNKQSGPGTVAFGDANSLATTASFTTAGTYVLRLTADDGEFTDVDSVTVSVHAGQPAAPTPIVGPDFDDDGAFALMWGAVPGASNYRLQRRIQGAGTWSTVQTASSTSYGETGLAEGTYEYRARACIGESNCSNWTSTKLVVVEYPIVVQMPSTIVGPRRDEDGTFPVAWGTVQNASSYTIQRRPTGESWSTQQSSSSTVFYESNLADGDWEYRVRACELTTCSEWTPTIFVEVGQSDFLAKPSGPPIVMSGNYAIYYPADQETTECDYIYLEEAPIGTSSWHVVGDVNHDGIATFSNKAAGEYQYRSHAACEDYYGENSWDVISDTITVQVFPVTGEPIYPSTTESQLLNTYVTRLGDLNADGNTDIYVARSGGGQPLDGSIDNVILLGQDNGIFSATVPSNDQLQIAAYWNVAPIAIRLDDFNADGFLDILLQDLNSSIVGAFDHIVYAPGKILTPLPAGLRAITPEFLTFIEDLHQFTIDQDYFTANSEQGQYGYWTYEIECELVWWSSDYPDWICNYYDVYEEYEVITYPGISAAAVRVWEAWEDFESGAGDYEEVVNEVERQLGAEVGSDDDCESVDTVYLAVPAALQCVGISVSSAIEAIRRQTLELHQFEEYFGRVPGTVYITGHNLFGTDFVHTALEYRDPQTLLPIWISAGPTLNASPPNVRLVGAPNRPSDMPSANHTIAVVTNVLGLTPEQYFGTASSAELLYGDCLPYAPRPEFTPFPDFNSNGFTAGLVAATLGIPDFSVSSYSGFSDFPGGTVSVPSSEFSPQSTQCN